ncbi:uncharacterized protein LOC111056205 isoform X2 [Nilaparvata lugens]|uniref:uncharacterized protein LOC111056205 isoform X2 n=1 Tax=Nilaparvata lugens TaxID=108931 RepID=UPI00193D99E5|nr:uncharacterized protein LOC111056205 isoform X2 [Nilaparvata lugens]
MHKVANYQPKQISSHEASQTSEEFLNMKSDIIAAQNRSELDLKVSRRPSMETTSRVTEINFPKKAVKENVENSKKITDYMKTSKVTVGKQSEPGNKTQGEYEIRSMVENITGKTTSNRNQVGASTLKETTIGKTTHKIPIPEFENEGVEFNFVKPKSDRKILKRKHSSSSEVGLENTPKSVDVKENDKSKIITEQEIESKKKKIKKTEEREQEIKYRKKHMKISLEEEEEKNDSSIENDVEIMKISSEVVKEKEIVNGKTEMKMMWKNEYEMKLKESNENKTDMTNIPGPSHRILGSVNKNKKSAWRDNSNILTTGTKNTELKKAFLKNKVQSKMSTRKIKSFARKSENKFGESFVPKRLTDKTTKFYFITNLMMERFGKRPVSLRKRKYPVPTNSAIESPIEAPNHSIFSTGRKSHTTVSVQTSPMKEQVKCVPSSSAKSVGGASASYDCFESKINLEHGNATNVCKKDGSIQLNSTIHNNGTENHLLPGTSTIIDKKYVSLPGHYTFVSEKSIENIGESESLTNIVSQEDIFEPPVSEEIVKYTGEVVPDEASTKMDMDEEIKKDAIDLTQVNPHIKNRDKFCTRKVLTPPSSLSVGCNQSRNRNNCDAIRESAQKTKKCGRPKSKNFTENESFQGPTSTVDGSLLNVIDSEQNSEKDLKTPKHQIRKNVHSNSSSLKIGGRMETIINSKTTSQKSKTPSQNSKTPQQKTKKSLCFSSPRNVIKKHLNFTSPVSNENIFQKAEPDSSEVTISVQKIQTSCNKSKRSVSNFSDEDTFESVNGSLDLIKQRNPLSFSCDLSKFTQPCSQGRPMTQMDTAFSGSDNSQRLSTQQKLIEEEIRVEVVEPPSNIIAESDEEEEIPQTPDKTEKSEILTQHNTSKLDKSMDMSIIPSSLNLSQMAKSNLNSTKAKKQSKRYSFVYSRLPPHLIQKVEEFAQSINAHITPNITDETTHVILAPVEDNMTVITYKFLKGIAKRLWLVNINWVLESLQDKKIKPEVVYLTMDPYGEPGPHRCKFDQSQLLADFTFLLKPPFSQLCHDQLKELIVLCGGTVVDKIEDFHKVKPKLPKSIILTDEELDVATTEYFLTQLCLIALHVSWLIESISAFKLMNVVDHLHNRSSATLDILRNLGLDSNIIQEVPSDSDEAESADSD